MILKSHQTDILMFMINSFALLAKCQHAYMAEEITLDNGTVITRSKLTGIIASINN